MNRSISAKRLEPLIWDEITQLLLDPDRLRKGYKESLAQQQASRVRYQAHLETLRGNQGKVEKKRQRLTSLYIDPDVHMNRTEYLEQKAQLDEELKAIQREIEEVEDELQNIPTPADLETLEIFATRVRERLSENFDPCPEDKRKILELLHVKVYLELDGRIRVEGWFESEKEDCGCLLATTSTRCALQRRPLPGRA